MLSWLPCNVSERQIYHAQIRSTRPQSANQQQNCICSVSNNNLRTRTDSLQSLQHVMICLLICFTDAKLKVSHHREATAPASAHILQMPAPSCEFKSTTLTNAGVFPMPDGCLYHASHSSAIFDTEAAAHQSWSQQRPVMPKPAVTPAS
jgi:hypothetical protein